MGLPAGFKCDDTRIERPASERIGETINYMSVRLKHSTGLHMNSGQPGIFNVRQSVDARAFSFFAFTNSNKKDVAEGIEPASLLSAA